MKPNAAEIAELCLAAHNNDRLGAMAELEMLVQDGGLLIGNLQHKLTADEAEVAAHLIEHADFATIDRLAASGVPLTLANLTVAK